MPEQYVNDQIVESVADVVTLNSGHAPAQSAAMLDVVMAETMGMSMYNAVSRQQSSSMVGAAAVTSACAKMLQTPFPILPPPIPPYPVPPPGLQPLPVPGLSPAEEIAVARVEAGEAINLLAADAANKDSNTAKAQLEALAKQIADALAKLSPAPGPTPVGPFPFPGPFAGPVPGSFPGPMAADAVRPVAAPREPVACDDPPPCDPAPAAAPCNQE